MPPQWPAKIQKKVTALQKADAPMRLLDWYDPDARPMPWRYEEGKANPYHVWLSEVMLQQTTVATVIPYFHKFIQRWPTLPDLASASLDDVLKMWAGLGYYARARNLKACAEQVVTRFSGEFPDDLALLKTLPGIGDYTAAAIASIAFEKRATVMDGNVERVMARLFAISEALPKAKKTLFALADSLTPNTSVGNYAQALMDLGATICTPRNPKCDKCPWQSMCAASKVDPERFPVRAKTSERPIRYTHAFCALNKGNILLRRRPERGLLGGMMEVPTSEWTESKASFTSAISNPPVTGDWQKLSTSVKHVFTHFELRVTIMRAHVDCTHEVEGQWFAIGSLDELALPTLMKKIIQAALKD